MQRQLNIRLAEEQRWVLEADAFLQGQALPDLVRSILQERVAVLASDPRIQQMMRMRAEERGITEGKVMSIRRRRAAAPQQHE